VNTMYADQWSDVAVIKQSYAHFFPWGPMWLQHFENRVFFPNIVVVLLTHTVHFNVQVEEYLGAVMLLASSVIICGPTSAVPGPSRGSTTAPWPSSSSRSSSTRTRSGIPAGLVHGVAGPGHSHRPVGSPQPLLDAAGGSHRRRRHRQLLLPPGTAHLADRTRAPVLPTPVLPYVGVWIAAAGASAILYFHNYDFAVTPQSQFARHHPLATVKFFLFAIGDVVGKPVSLGSTDPDNRYVVLFGLVIVALAVGTVVIVGLRRDVTSSSPVGVALICYGLLFAALITQGRSFLGFGGASFSRYTTFDVLILVGIYLALLGRVPGASLDLTTAEPEVGPAGPTRPRRTRNGWSDRVALPGALAIVLVAIVVQIPLGAYNGVQGARSFTRRT